MLGSLTFPQKHIPHDHRSTFMTSSVLSTLARTMRESGVPHALLDCAELSPIAVNLAFDRMLREHRVENGLRLLHDYANVVAALKACAAQGSHHDIDLANTALRLEVRPVQDDASKVLAVQCVITTAALHAPSHSSGLDASFRRALEQLPLNAWMCSPEGEIFWINETSNLFSHAEKVIVDPTNSHWIGKIHPDDLSEGNRKVATAMAGGPIIPFRYRVKDTEGRYHWHVSHYGPVHDGQGDILHWVGTGTNIQPLIDEQQVLSAQVNELQARLQYDKNLLWEANSMLAKTQKMELVSNLAAGVAHDLNNLLFIMGLNADLLYKNLQDAHLRESANNVRANIKKAARLASQLMGFSGRKPQSVRAVDPRELLDELRDLLIKAVGAEVTFSIHLDDEVDAVMVDKMYLENSLINLAINARDAVKGNGSIKLAVCNQRLTREGRESDYVVFRMHDDGEGIPDDIQKRIFEPFFTTKATNKGTGLGLPMVKMFVESSGGMVDVQSMVGVGTTMSLYLPKSTQTVVNVIDRAEAPRIFANQSLLIIDDDIGVRNALANTLLDVGFKSITTAFNSEYAMQFLQGGLQVDLIISDIKMPGRMSISLFMEQLKLMAVQTPVIFVTGYSEDVLIEQGLVDGKYPVLFKPFTLNELLAKIQEIVAATEKLTTEKLTPLA